MRRFLTTTAFLLLFVGIGFSQRAALFETTNFSPQRKRDISFTHQPFLLLKWTPTALLGNPAYWQVGAEIAPPFGRFSFNGDYAIGANWNIRKNIRNSLNNQSAKMWRAEIRAYFSDLYPFYALDKKPFGRYYAIEYQRSNIGVNLNARLPEGSTDLANFTEGNLEQAIHFKYGKHFLINKNFFIDGYFGIGPGLRKQNSLPMVANEAVRLGYQWQGYGQMDALVSVPTDALLKPESLSRGDAYEVTVRPNGSSTTSNLSKVFFSKTAGVRLCLVF